MKKVATLLITFGLLAGCQSAPVHKELESPVPGAEGGPGKQPAPVEEGVAPATVTAPMPQTLTPSWQPIGFSVQARPILAAERGQGPKRILLVGGIHGDEIEGRSAVEAMIDRSAFPDATLRIIQDINPDGTQAHRRANAHGVDLNRNWPAANFRGGTSGGAMALSEPETRVLADQIRVFTPDIVIVLHSAVSGPFVNFDGPASELAEAFVRNNPVWRVQSAMGYETPGSLGSYLGIDRGVPILTVEFKRGQDNSSAKADLGRGLKAVILAVRVDSGAKDRTQ